MHPQKNNILKLSKKKISILETAEKLFAENGFSGTSIRMIAQKADINVAMVSYYFGSKRNLLKELTLYRSYDFQEELQRILTPTNDYFSKIDLIIAFVIRRLHKNRRIHKITNFEYSKNSGQDDFKEFIEQKRQNYEHIQDFIKKGQEEGAFAKNINTPLIITTIIGTYFNFYYNKKLFGAIHQISEDITINNFVETQLIPHLQRSVKAILTYEN